MRWCLCLIFLVSLSANAQTDRNSGPSPITQTQERRKSERFDIISWIRSNNATRAAQDAKYGRGTGKSGGGPFPDLVLSYQSSPVTLKREGATVGTYTRATGKIQFLLDDLFTAGNRFRTLNSDLGFEVSYSATRDFKADSGFTQAAHAFSELGGAFLIRPIGRSSQDSYFMLKAGYLDIKEQGFWSNSTTDVNLFAPYLGADVKLYLLPFLGLKGEYQYLMETDVGPLAGRWKGSRFTYGGYVEISLVTVEAFLFTHEAALSTNAGVSVNETATGMGFGVSLFF